MDSQHNPENPKSRRLKALYDKLAVIKSQISGERLAAARDLLSDESLAMDLRQAITDSGMTHYAIGKASGVAPGMIDRFMTGERDLRLSTAGKLADALGYRLTKISTAKKKAKKKPS